jgi:aminoglycoside phosphotransferase family enzyme
MTFAAITPAATLAFLRLPMSYGSTVHAVDCIETHMSWLFFTETSVYKLKKPVVFPFLDFSTLSARAFF